MLYHLLYPLKEKIGFLNVIGYLTFRSMLAFIIAFVLVLVFQPIFIRWFQNRSLGQPIREDGPESHHEKKGTPTMGGMVLIFAITISTLLIARLDNYYIWVTLGLTISYAFLGFLDDYKKVKKKDTGGVSARMKLFWQFGFAGVFVFLLMNLGDGFSTEVGVPFFKTLSFDLGWWFLPFGAIVVVGCSNAVNLTDGLDGLVTGPIMTVAFAYGIFAYACGHAGVANYLQIPGIPGCGELSVFAAAIIASGMGFLWFNSFPAQVFMGDVGSLSIGGALGMLALITKQELVLPIAGGIFVIEALSVIIQVGYFKWTGKRVFRMAPIHHHYELKGISEPKIIVRFWIVSMILAIVALATLKLR